MDALTEIFSQKSTDWKQRALLKDEIQRKFKLLFIKVNYHSPQLVMQNKTSLENSTTLAFMRENKKSELKHSARVIREETLHMIQEAPSLAWTPKTEYLLDIQRQPPKLL